MPGDEAAIQALDQWIDDWNARVQERADAATSLARELEAVAGEATVGHVTATVDPSGALLTLHLDDALRSETVRRASEQLLNAVDEARAVAIRKAADLADGTVGPDSETGRALVAGLSCSSATSSTVELTVDDDVATVWVRPSGRIVEIDFGAGFLTQPASETADVLVALTRSFRMHSGHGR